MSYFKVVVLFSVFSLTVQAQSFYNGSFENHSLTACTSNQSDQLFNTKMPHVKAFGKTNTGNPAYLGETDILDTLCFTPQQGGWCLGIASNTGTTSDAVAIELNSPLAPGITYYLSFYVYGNSNFQNLISGVKVGESLTDSTFGTQINLAIPNYNTWSQINFSFTASQASEYITVKTVPGYSSWNLIDNFEIARSPIPLTTGVEELKNENSFLFYPNPVVTNLTLQFANAPQFCEAQIYNELGQLAFLKKDINSQVTILDLSSLPRGFYTLRMSDGIWCVCRKLVIAR
ncbi:hypothetical protein CNR22_17210 [Sphingobacteriaceae bacterium]|nr:hypothetical protein CNR22_17210 [Sphingobacteriaceae bacterium]